MTLDIFKIQ